MKRIAKGFESCGYVGSIKTLNSEYYNHVRAGMPQPFAMNVYFIQGHPDHAIKIGTAKNPYQRLASIQIGSPVPLVLVAFQEGNRELERRYHDRFKTSRSHGEWFNPTSELTALIQSIGLPAPKYPAFDIDRLFAKPGSISCHAIPVPGSAAQ